MGAAQESPSELQDGERSLEGLVMSVIKPQGFNAVIPELAQAAAAAAAAVNSPCSTSAWKFLPEVQLGRQSR